MLLLLLRHPANLCHAAELEDSQCVCPESDLPKNSVNEGSGVGIQFINSSFVGCSSRRTLTSGKPVISLVLAAATVALYGSTSAVFAYLSLMSLKNFSRLQMMSVVQSNRLNPSAMDDFDDYDHIMSRGRIRARQQPKAR